MAAEGPVLSVEGLQVTFVDKDGVNRAVKDATLSVKAGEVLGIVGESGSGKTVTCASAMGLLHGWPGVVGGKIWFDPRDGEGPRNLLGGMERMVRFTPDGKVPVKDRRGWRFFIRRQFKPWWGAGMTMIFQNPQTALNPFWKVSKTVGEAVRQRERGLDGAAVRKQGLEWLERVRLNNPERVWESYPHELSGGMAQRAMIAAALARGARLLFADEPTTGLDTTVKARIVELFGELRKTENVAMVVISHDLGVVASLADQIVVMKEGKILETRSVEEITSRAPELHEYTRRLLGAVDVWKKGSSGDASVAPRPPRRPARKAPGAGVPGGTSSNGNAASGSGSADECRTRPLTSPEQDDGGDDA